MEITIIKKHNNLKLKLVIYLILSEYTLSFKRTIMKLKYVIIILYCIIESIQNNIAKSISGGLEFQANNVSIPYRTSWKLFSNGIKSPKDSLKIQFDMGIYGDNMLGHVLTCNGHDTEYFNVIVYQDITLSDTLYFNLNLTLWNQKIVIPIPRKQAKKWQNFSINIYPKEGKAVFCIDNIKRTVTTKTKRTIKDLDINVFFGRCGHYIDLLPFSLRNVYYIGDNKTIFFPLNNDTGELVYSHDRKYKGDVENPLWLKTKYSHWYKVAELEEDEIAAIFHDKLENNIIVRTSDKTIIFDTFSWNKTEKKPNNKEFKFLRGEANYIYDFHTNNLIMFNNIHSADYSSTFKYNYKSNKLYAVGNSNLKYKYHHNSVFSDKKIENIYQFGGYYALRYSNSFYSMNTKDYKWKVTSFSGDTIMPRFYTSVGYDFNDDNEFVYLYGGYGNESGFQNDGSRYFYDLYRLNLKDSTIKRICNFPLSGFDYVPSRDLILSRDGEGFYTICSSQYKPKSHARLYKFNWNDSTCKAIADSIPYISQKISTQVHLFEDTVFNCFICAIQEFVTADKSKIKIYKIAHPSEETLTLEQKMNERSDTKLYLITVFIIILILIVLGVHLKRKKCKENTQYSESCFDELSKTDSHDKLTNHVVKTEEENNALEDNSENQEICKNAIYLLGDFTVFDKSGKDITYMFSSKIRQLFILILFHSYKSHSSGISSNEISSIIWPDKELSKSKNVRGVTMKNLKEVLSEIDGVGLIYKSGKWIIELDQMKCFCDYISLILSNINISDDYNTIKQYIMLLRRGRLLQAESFDWMDTFKSDFEEAILDRFYSYMVNAYKNFEYSHSYNISRILLIIAPLNEDIMRIEINSLSGMGDIVKARMRFRQFALNYYEVYGVNIDIDDFLESENKS